MLDCYKNTLKVFKNFIMVLLCYLLCTRSCIVIVLFVIRQDYIVKFEPVEKSPMNVKRSKTS